MPMRPAIRLRLLRGPFAALPHVARRRTQRDFPLVVAFRAGAHGTREADVLQVRTFSKKYPRRCKF
ncbi:hypothetical protein PCAR4_50034 [Paraburkholderia caribensis]|nr:hypothetical protein PCAR4_50034 [Paraburkholderia caribensis]